MRIAPPPGMIYLAPMMWMIPFIMFVIGGEAGETLWQEGGPVENLSAAFYAVGFLTAALSLKFIKGLGRAHLTFWMVFCIVCFGEETSWLQHAIGYDTPDFMAGRNAQNEFNLHNLDALQGGKLAGEEGNLSAAALLKSQNLFQLGFLIFFFVLPTIIRVRLFERLVVALKMPVPSVRFMLLVWPGILLSIALSVIAAGTTKSAVAETRELLYAATIAAFLIGAMVTLRPSRSARSRAASMKQAPAAPAE